MKTNKKYLTDDEYKLAFSLVPRLCLDFIIVKDGGVILSKRAIKPFSGYWHLPGGMVRKGEKIKEAAQRIISNELGVKLIEIKLVGFMEFPNEINKNGLHIYSVSMVFLTKLSSGKISSNEQSSEVKSFKIIPKNIHPVHGKFLKENKKNFIK